MTLFAKADLTAATDVLVYTVTGTPVTVNVRLTNRAQTPTRVSIALVANGDSLSNADWIEYRVRLQGNQPLESGGFPLEVGAKVYCRSELAGTSAKVMGISR